MRVENKVGCLRRIKQAWYWPWLLLASPVFGQGTMIFDQSSASENAQGEFAIGIQPNQPIGQSFTPSLDGVGFIRLYTGDSSFNGVGATLYVNLRSDSMTGPIIGTTSAILLPDGFVGRTNFFFTTQVPVTPGVTYYFQPVVQSGDTWQIISDSGQNFSYAGGTAFYHGTASPFEDLWFREGIIVPEPSLSALLIFGGGAVVYVRRNSKPKN
jgi:hypothetical protein